MKFPALHVSLLVSVMQTLSAAEPPNIIYILADDLGVSDLGVYGSKFYDTPNIDRLARDGMLFSQAYSACPVCSPTRASFLTGKSPAELKLTDWIPGRELPFARLKIPAWTKRLSPELTTLADILRNAGYATASIGKWHLGEVSPTEYGFDLNVGGGDKGKPDSYFSPYRNEALPNGPKGEFLSDRITAEAEKWIEANKDRPFFLYLPHFAVHTPIQAKPEVVAKYRARIKVDDRQNNPVYAALVESLDDSVGRIRAKLEALGLAEKTMIVFTSDNGGLLSATFNIGVRGGKGSAYEGGTRVPLIYCWPGKIPPHSRCDIPTITGNDFYTILAAAGVQAPSSGEFQSLLPALLSDSSLEARDLFWHYPHYDKRGSGPFSAVRSGDYKLIEFFDPPRLELYNLKVDPLEKDNLATADPKKLDELQSKLTAWRTLIHAQMPEQNPAFDPLREKQIPKAKISEE